MKDLFDRPGFRIAAKLVLVYFGFVLSDHHALATLQGKQQGQTAERDSLSTVRIDQLDSSTAADSDFTTTHSIHIFEELQKSMQSYYQLITNLGLVSTDEDKQKQLDKLAITFGRVCFFCGIAHILSFDPYFNETSPFII